RVLGTIERMSASFVVSKRSADTSKPEFRNAYFNLEKLRKIDPQFEFPGFAFNTGVWVGTSGLLRRELFDPHIVWGSPIALRRPDIFSCADQGLLNYVLLSAVRRGKITLETAEFMLWGQSKQMANVSWKSIEHREGVPFVAHYAGAKPASLREFIGCD